MPNKSKIIAFAGIDGCGKSTQLKLVYDALISSYSVYVSKLTYMPLNDMNQNFLKDLLIECRSGLEILKQALLVQRKTNEYDYILCDRYLMCYLAYAYAYGMEPIETIKKMLFFLKNPDLTLYFDIDVQIALERIKSRGKALNKHENYNTLLKAQEGYAKLYNSVGDLEIIDANKSIEEVNKSVMKSLTLRKVITHL